MNPQRPVYPMRCGSGDTGLGDGNGGRFGVSGMPIRLSGLSDFG